MPTDRRTFIKTTTGGMTALALSPLLEPVLAQPFRAAHSIGLIGCGRQGRDIIGEVSKMDNVSILAVCDTDESRRNNAARRARGAETVADYRALLARNDIEAIVVATPTHQHRQIAVDALSAGKHVYCESPLASTIDDCRAIVKAANASSTVFQTGMQGRLNPIYRLAWTFVRSGSIRDFVGMQGQWHQKTSWRTPAADAAREQELNWRLDPERSIGLAGEIGTQQFDVFNWYLGGYPTKVRGNGSIRLWNDGRKVADTIAATLTYDGGVELQYDATLANSYESKHELMHGTMGTVKLTWTHGWLFKEADAPTQGWEVYANRQQFHNEEGITLIADATQLAAQGRLKEGVGLPNDSLYYALEDFVRAIDDGGKTRCSAEEGMKAAIVGIKTNEAIVSGEEVTIDPALFEPT